MDLLRSTTSNHNVKKREKKTSVSSKGREEKFWNIKDKLKTRFLECGYTRRHEVQKSQNVCDSPKKQKLFRQSHTNKNGSSIKLVSDSSFRAAIIRAPKKILFTYSLAGTMVKGEPRVKQRGKLPPAVNRCRHYNLALTRTHKVHFM